ncbi:MAG: hypothetical protein WBR18_11850 [Anaerolineales bacterium]
MGPAAEVWLTLAVRPRAVGRPRLLSQTEAVEEESLLMTAAGAQPVLDPQGEAQSVGEAVPYDPSFIDRLTHFVKRLPLPYGITYLLLFIVESIAILVFFWIDGWLSTGKFDPIVFLFPLWLWGPLTIVTYLDSLSLRALSEFGPLLEISAETKRRLEYEFTTMPASGVLISGAAWLIVYILSWLVAFRYSLAAYGFGAISSGFLFVVGFISFAVGSVIYYHSMRQLRLVNRVVGMVPRFDLFRLDPVYAFSVLTSRTGICWVVLLSLSLLILPLEIGKAPELSMLILQLGLAIGAFLLPLRAVNRRLVMEKRGQLAEVGLRMKSTLMQLHQHIDENALQEVPRLNDTLKGLTSEREILARIPTWPWRPGLFAGFISVIVLPIVLFLLQFGLSEWLAR